MKALVKTGLGPDTLRLMDIPVPEYGPDDLLVKVYACGICASDLHIENFLILWYLSLQSKSVKPANIAGRDCVCTAIIGLTSEPDATAALQNTL